MSPQRQSREFWHVALHTDVKFRCEMMLVTRGIVRNLLLIAFMDVHVCVIAMCWNRVLTPGFIKERNLQLTLHCPVCLYRSYFEHVADTVSQWTRQEESKRDTTQDGNDTPESDSPEGIVL